MNNSSNHDIQIDIKIQVVRARRMILDINHSRNVSGKLGMT